MNAIVKKVVMPMNINLFNSGNFLLTKTDMGEDAYDWTDSGIENYSSVHLAKALRALEQDRAMRDSGYFKAIKQELVIRGQYQVSKKWCF